MKILQIEIDMPDWTALKLQPNIRFGNWQLIQQQSVPWVITALQRLREGFPPDHVCDVRFWPNLQIGQVPGVKIGWHKDLTREGGYHRLYSCGAGSITEFYGDIIIPAENRCVEYSLDIHRARPAMYSGPRVLLRVTQPPKKSPRNVIGLPSWHHTE